MPLRILFMGAAELASASLRALMSSPLFDVAAVVTQPDRPKGRDLKVQLSTVKRISMETGLPVMQPQRLRDGEFNSSFAALSPDLIVVVAYGQILPQSLLDLPRLGCVNVHASLLPRHRGAAPIQWAILLGESTTGVTIMKMAAGLDTGDILAQKETPIGPEETAEQLQGRLALLGAELLVTTLPGYSEGVIRGAPQDNAAATYARKINKDDGRIDWSHAAADLRNRLRAFTPWPGLFAELTIRGKARLVKFWRVAAEELQGEPGTILQADSGGLIIACGSGALRVHELQVDGGRRMTAAEFLSGHALTVREPWK